MGKVKAAKFVRGERRRIAVPHVDLRPAPNRDIGIDSQLLFNDPVRVFDEADGWAWVQSLRDNYVGYIPENALGASLRTALPTTHVVCVPRTFRYDEPDMKLPIFDALSIGSAIVVTGATQTRGTDYAETVDGKYIIAKHLQPMDRYVDDYVSVAEMLLHTPYLWGGCTAFGTDCSGLVQLSMLLAGKKVQRDTDMQAKTIGTELGFAAMDGGLMRGDLVFWKGHVGIMRDPQTLIHANGHTMDVALEPLENAIERIRYLYGFPTVLRRP
ncbi:MAG: NlpC/P60 family protein [Ahrensia sp.]|nr:NlpC/P60 family protein [Ahrensia sp.]